MTDPLLRWRKEFPIVTTSTYLISNSLGAMPRSVFRRMERYATLWATRGVRAWAEEWWEMPVAVGDLIAPLIGAGTGEVSMHTNVSLIQAALISCFDFSGRKNGIVLNDLDFPSVLYVYQQLAGGNGARLKFVKSPDGKSVPTEQILAAIDDRTLLVPLSHVTFKHSAVQDVPAIVRKAHRHGALVILDTYHSAGVMPVDVRSLRVDILVGGVLKWLCGGPGGAFLWMRPRLRKSLMPRITGWMAHQRPFAFETAMAYRDGADRFLNGTPAIPALYAATEGPRIIGQIGVEKIRAKSGRQTSLLIREALAAGFTVLTPLDPKLRGGAVTLSVPHAYEVSRELLRRSIIVDYREGAGIRLAPHFYTSDEEVLQAVGEIGEILRTGSHRRHSRRRTPVT